MPHPVFPARVLAVCVLLVGAACAPASLIDVQVPSGTIEPDQVTTPAAATQLYNFAVTRFDQRMAGAIQGQGGADGAFVGAVGLFTDELMRVQASSVGGIPGVGVDERTGSGGTIYGTLYTGLHNPRVAARQAREALVRYAPDTPVAWQGRLYALEGNAVLWFAELFCSGIPLTTVPLVDPQVLTAGLTTEELFERAVGLFDTAITLSTDSARFLNLARVGKGRALLGLGRFADAAAAVQGVPTDFAYTMYFQATINPNLIGARFKSLQVVDGEGLTGLTWSTDPRAAIVTNPTVMGAMRMPGKYSRLPNGQRDPTVSVPDNPLRVADGVEARLIEAEADLAANGANWLTILNALRATCAGTAACASVSDLAVLPALADPGTPAARLDLLMRERALWLYLTGHRQGDLRRLARIYQRDPGTLWPKGTYVNLGFPPFTLTATTHGTPYGSDVVMTPAASEIRANPLYRGCFNTEP